MMREQDGSVPPESYGSSNFVQVQVTAVLYTSSSTSSVAVLPKRPATAPSSTIIMRSYNYILYVYCIVRRNPGCRSNHGKPFTRVSLSVRAWVSQGHEPSLQLAIFIFFHMRQRKKGNSVKYHERGLYAIQCIYLYQAGKAPRTLHRPCRCPQARTINIAT